ncbi:hypothetical protein WM08_15230 [Burkholderia ubonensis]|uniref:hypothetical protein n=1 Tax=Burkholderia ubonensis TaxID=101571 RepID=UPI00075FC624|nr:hypothetical protein [Burkholderia ubonensis]KWI90206.1 hypothetical protein WM08_15230 [Burkholderia ubonensis]
MDKRHDIIWLDQPEEHDYPAAESYLSLVMVPRRAATFARALRRARVERFKAKDIFRAARLPLLGGDNHHVKRNGEKIRSGRSLSPILLVRGESGRLVIADGYHRLCAVYLHDEDAEIPCKIVGGQRCN